MRILCKGERLFCECARTLNIRLSFLEVGLTLKPEVRVTGILSRKYDCTSIPLFAFLQISPLNTNEFSINWKQITGDAQSMEFNLERCVQVFQFWGVLSLHRVVVF